MFFIASDPIAGGRLVIHHGVCLLALHPLLRLLPAPPAPLPDLGPRLRDQLHVEAGPRVRQGEIVILPDGQIAYF